MEKIGGGKHKVWLIRFKKEVRQIKVVLRNILLRHYEWNPFSNISKATSPARKSARPTSEQYTPKEDKAVVES